MMAVFPTALQAQQSTVASGGDASGSGGFVSFSIGQVVYYTDSGTTGTVAQGIQHAYEIFTVGVQDVKFNFLLSVFPNPTTERLILQAENYDTEKLRYQLFDMQGKLLKSELISTNRTEINMSGLTSGNYLLIISTENKSIKQFKIIKN
ncbi:MAG: hypothetical protein BGO29_10685 [Bacteroidales bacterium 36-12]|nr:MAG: hypothetical protein BGO29_10685 [Bacteroidales bacterium 36-12]